MSRVDVTNLMKELLRKDRLAYVEIIMKSEEGARSIEIAEEILGKTGITEHSKIKKENIVVNKRLRTLVDLGILISHNKGKYKVGSLGYLLLDSWKNIAEKAETMEKFGSFFEDHLVKDIPKEFFRQMYRLRSAELTENATHWGNMLRKQMEQTERKLYNMTQYLHDYPEEVLEKRRREEIDIVIIYQFNDYPMLNFSDEKKLFDKLVDVKVDFRYINLEKKHPIGVRVVDEKWATFLLPKIGGKQLDREHAFVGIDQEFVSWCRDFVYTIWHFEAKPLDVNKVIAKKKE